MFKDFLSEIILHCLICIITTELQQVQFKINGFLQVVIEEPKRGIKNKRKYNATNPCTYNIIMIPIGDGYFLAVRILKVVIQRIMISFIPSYLELLPKATGA